MFEQHGIRVLAKILVWWFRLGMLHLLAFVPVTSGFGFSGGDIVHGSFTDPVHALDVFYTFPCFPQSPDGLIFFGAKVAHKKLVFFKIQKISDRQ